MKRTIQSNVKKLKLDKIDHKLLHEIYHNYRTSFVQIAKKCNISREQAEYRVNKYEQSGLVKKYATLFNYNSLGYNEFVIIKLKTTTDTHEEIIKKLTVMKNRFTVLKAFGKYNILADFVFRDKNEFEEFFYSFIKQEKGIMNYDFVFTTHAELFPLKFLNSSFSEGQNYSLINETSQAKLTPDDIKILKLLDDNGNIKLIDISKKTGIASNLLLYKLKKFKEQKIITGQRVQLDLSKIGFSLAIYSLRLKENTRAVRSKIISFCKLNKNVNALTFGIGQMNCNIQLIYGDDENLKSTLLEIDNFISEHVEDSELLLLGEETPARLLPL